jgi:hypothetical protein
MLEGATKGWASPLTGGLFANDNWHQYHRVLQQHQRLHGTVGMGRGPKRRGSVRTATKRRMLHGDVNYHNELLQMEAFGGD